MSNLQQTNTEKAPWHLWVIGIAGFLWSSMGALDYVMTQTKNESYMSGFSSDQLAFYYGLPSWVVVTWAIAVWGGVVGAIFLLLRKGSAVWIFLASLIALLITMFQNYVLSSGMEVVGDTASLVFAFIIFVIALVLFMYARAMQRRGVLV